MAISSIVAEAEEFIRLPAHDQAWIIVTEAGGASATNLHLGNFLNPSGHHVLDGYPAQHHGAVKAEVVKAFRWLESQGYLTPTGDSLDFFRLSPKGIEWYQSHSKPTSEGLPNDINSLSPVEATRVADDHEPRQEKPPEEPTPQLPDTPSEPAAAESEKTSGWLSNADIDRFSDQTRQIMAVADQARKDQKKDRVYTEHVVFALSQESQLPALTSAAGVELNDILKQDFGVAEAAPIEFRGLPPISNNARSALVAARDKANALASKTIDESHLLYGVLSQAASPIVQELNKRGITPDKVTFFTAGEPPSAHIATDSWTVDDKLGHGAYARAIYRFITDEKTRPPLAISIQAPWGGGKTSLMRMIQRELDPETVLELERKRHRFRDNDIPPTIQPEELKEGLGHKALKLREVIEEIRKWKNPEPTKKIDNPSVPRIEPAEVAAGAFKPKHRVTVWFNAWKYQNTEQVWAGLADCIMREVTGRMNIAKRQKFWFQLQLSRIDTEKIERRISERILSESLRLARGWALAIVPLTLVFVANALRQHEWLSWTGTGGALASALGGPFLLYLKAKSDVEKEPAELSVGEYLQVPDYPGKLGFIHEVAEDLTRVINAIPPDELPIVLFIDDLDRCSPQKVAEVTEGINLFLAGEFPDCIFVFGMDAEMVAAALEKAHSDVIGKLPAYAAGIPVGWRFMDKFVQLPFVIPPPEKEDLKTYVRSLLEDEAVKQPIPKEVQGMITDPDRRRDPAATAKAAEQMGLSQAQQREVHFQMERAERLAEIDAEIDRATRDTKAVQEFVLKVAPDLYRNPRDLKRFLNTFRLHDFLRIARETRKLPAPSRDLIVDWIRLSLRWPQVVRWMQRVPGDEASDITQGHDRGTLRFRLEQLEKTAGEVPDSEGVGTWAQRLQEKLGPTVENSEWLHDPALFDFFRQISKREEPQGRLSYGAGKGLW